MELIDVMSQVRVLFDEAKAYAQAGNYEDAAKMLVAMKAYLNDQLPIKKVFKLPNPKTHRPTSKGAD